MKNNFTIIQFNDRQYKVCKDHNNNIFVVDNDLQLPNKKFYTMQNSYIGYSDGKPLYLQNTVMNYTFNGNLYIDHINRIPADNRLTNLRLITQSEQNKNQSKRKRNVILPDNCRVNKEEIPTFIWYIKENSGHGDRWAVDIKNKHFWKSTSSKILSTKYKFELAKKYLRELNLQRPNLFISHCQNGKLSIEGEVLQKEYFEILKLAGYNYNIIIDNNEYLKEDLTGLTDKEKELLKLEINLKDNLNL